MESSRPVRRIVFARFLEICYSKIIVDCYDIGLRVFARFLAMCFLKMIVMTLFEFSPARSLLAEEEKSS